MGPGQVYDLTAHLRAEVSEALPTGREATWDVKSITSVGITKLLPAGDWRLQGKAALY